jgi:hypothetical protein
MATYELFALLLSRSIDCHDYCRPDQPSATTRVVDPLGTRMVQSQGLHGRWVGLGKLHRHGMQATRILVPRVFRTSASLGSEHRSN